MKRCTQLDLIDFNTGELTEWGEKVKKVGEEKYRDLRQRSEIFAQDRGKENIIERFRRAYEIEEVPESLDEGILNDIAFASWEMEMPLSCPHNPETSGKCIFHMSPEERDKHDIYAEEVTEAFREELESVGRDEHEYKRRSENTFVGSNLSHLDLQYRTVDSETNNSIDLRYSSIRTLSFDETTVERDLMFDSSTLGSATFKNASIESDVSFKNVEFEEEANFEGAGFNSRSVSFERAVFHGGANFKSTSFSGRNLSFQSSVFHSEAKFQKAILKLKSCKFEGVKFYGGVQFEKLEAYCDMNFSGAHIDIGGFVDAEFVGGELILKGAESNRMDFMRAVFHQDINFHRAQIDRLDFSESVFHQKANLTNLTGTEDNSGTKGLFEDCIFYGPVLLEGAIFDILKMEDAEFSGEAEFNSLTVHGKADLSEATFKKRADFSKSDFSDSVDFEDVDFSEATFQEVSSDAVVRMRDAKIGSGVFSQTDGSHTFYDMERCDIGDVVLKPEKDPDLFDKYRFLLTDLDGFKFSRYELGNRDWCIHSIGGGDFREATYAELEQTYTMAKNAAEQAGESKISSEFFQKELKYRRKSHWKNVKDGRRSIRDRLGSAFDWMSNSVLWISSGYGEKPSKVVLTSFAVILFYAMIYTGLWSLISSEPPVGYSGFGGSMVFSLESFTTLVLGGGEVDPNVVKFVGYSEGFLGAFLIALFVFTLTRSVHR